MFKEKEWLLWAAAALLVLVTCVLAVAGTPDMAPVTVEYPSAETTSAPAADTAPTDGTALTTATSAASHTPSGSETQIVPTTSASQKPTDGPTAPMGKININTADKETLMLLDGVGEVIAGRIIEYRETYGGFDTIEELMEVKGIGEKRFAAWKPYITV